MHDKQVRRRRAVLALLVVVSLISLTAYFGGSASNPLHQVQRGFVEVLSPLQEGASKALKPVRDVAGWFSSTFHAKSQVGKLRTEVADLRSQLAVAQARALKEPKLAALVSLGDRIGAATFHPVSAQVIERDPTLWYQTVEVDKGAADGVRQGDPVIAPGGLVGKVNTVGANFAVVTLITDHTMAVAARVQNAAGDSGDLQPDVGNPQDLLLQFLPRTAQVSEGQLVVTTGFKDGALQDLYPEGIPIGTVSRASQAEILDNGQVHVAPAVDLRHLDVVQVLTEPHSGGARAQVGGSG